MRRTFGAVILLCAAFASCGGGQQPDAIVKVGSQAITQADFDHWTSIWSRGPSAESRLEPPRFEACVAFSRRAGADSGAAPSTASGLRRECRNRFTILLGLLVERHWLEQEAQRLHVRLDTRALHATVRARYEQTLAGLSPGGQKPQGARLRVLKSLVRLLRQQRLSAQLTRQVRGELLAEDGAISERDVIRFYKRYPKRFATPAARRVRIFSASTAAQTKRIARALRSGQGWRRFAGSIALDANTTASSSGRAVIFDNRGDQALLRAVFATPVGRVGGPVHTLNGDFVFVVDGATPRAQSLASTRGAIRRFLERQRILRVQRTFNARYRRVTVCKSAYVIAHCATQDAER